MHNSKSKDCVPNLKQGGNAAVAVLKNMFYHLYR